VGSGEIWRGRRCRSGPGLERAPGRRAGKGAQGALIARARLPARSAFAPLLRA
jgi:hypothetical protein